MKGKSKKKTQDEETMLLHPLKYRSLTLCISAEDFERSPKPPQVFDESISLDLLHVRNKCIKWKNIEQMHKKNISIIHVYRTANMSSIFNIIRTVSVANEIAEVETSRGCTTFSS
jgi:hypothetical protein